jgi:hypothetical protein
MSSKSTGISTKGAGGAISRVVRDQETGKFAKFPKGRKTGFGAMKGTVIIKGDIVGSSYGRACKTG